jgi:hypothetical protein
MCKSTLSLTSALYGGGWLRPRLGRFTLRNYPVAIIQGHGWTTGPVWTGAENLSHTGIRIPDRLGRSESVYRLTCPGPQPGNSVTFNGMVMSTPLNIRNNAHHRNCHDFNILRLFTPCTLPMKYSQIINPTKRTQLFTHRSDMCGVEAVGTRSRMLYILNTDPDARRILPVSNWLSNTCDSGL